MDLCCVHAVGADFLLRSSFSEKPNCWGLKAHSMAVEVRVSWGESFPGHCRYRSALIKAMAKKNPGDSSNYDSNSSSSSGNNDNLKSGGDGLKGNNNNNNKKKSGDNGSNKSQHKPLDWREFRASLYIQEQAENADNARHQERRTTPAQPKPLPHKWAHPISAPEIGCLLVASEKLDGFKTFERTVILLLRLGTKNPQEGPHGIIINRPLNKKMKHMNPTNIELGTTFADCSLHFGGPVDASMYLLKADENIEPHGIEEVISGLYFGSRNSLDKAAALVKKGSISPRDLRFFIGYAGWQMDQLIEEIESDYWYLAACSTDLILQSSSSSDDLWGEVLRLMGGRYSELSRKPKKDM
ncbi:Protein of unknown function (DUF179 [Striga hermonthica]|uniref:Uncharacterized protein n=1 Tax=Striga hermonthica TaxID=68872 RepID=A0A9N7RQP7_STRHE|nr:Protein of unknown function (DUF179 [Striga hermonthica]